MSAFDDLSVGELCEPLAGRAWDRRAVRDQCERRAAHYADLGLRRFDRVFLLHGNTLEFFADLLAIWRLGGCAVPVDSRLTPFEVETLARAAAPRFAIAMGSLDSAIEARLATLDARVVDSREAGAQRMRTRTTSPSELAALDDDALVLFTSGTTGEPKGVVHTHRSLRARWTALAANLDLDAFARTLCLLPTHFGHGLICNSLFPWLAGKDLFVLPPFKLEVLARLGPMLDEFKITCMSSVPAVWRLALKAVRPPTAGTLDHVFCGSAPFSASLWSSVREWTGAKQVLNAYGITETGSWLAGTTLDGFVPEDGLIGVAWGGKLTVQRTGSTVVPLDREQECAPGEPGFVWVETPALMRGYLGRDDLTAKAVKAGRFSTGDIGYLDDRGVLYLKGREREEINKGGMKIHPGDVDGVVERFDGAIDVCTFGYDDALQGQDVGIAVVLHSTDDATLARLYEWTARHLASHKLPQRWYLLPEIPRNARGKVNRATVAAACARLAPVDVRRSSRAVRGAPT